jgi:hypothetical protein
VGLHLVRYHLHGTLLVILTISTPRKGLEELASVKGNTGQHTTYSCQGYLLWVPLVRVLVATEFCAT